MTLWVRNARILSVIKQFCVGVILVSYVAVAQPAEQMLDGSLSSIQHSADPAEVQGYTELCKAVYWEHMRGYREVKKHIVTALQLDPDSSFLYAKLAEVLIVLKEFRRATLACEKSLVLNPHNTEAHYLLGILKFVRQDRHGAIDEFKAVARLKPQHIGAQSRLSSLLFEEQDYGGAARAYSEMVKLRPYDPKLRYRLGVSYYRTGEAAKAIKEFNAVARLRKDYLEARFYLARLYAGQSRNKEAIEECLIVLQNSPEDANTTLLLTELYVSMAEFDKAIPIAQKLVERRGIDRSVLAEAHYRLAMAYRGRGEADLADLHFEKSIEMYKEILEKESENTDIHYYIAVVYDTKGDLSLAERHLRKHIELRPDEPNAYNFLGYMFVENDMNLEEAVALIKKAVEMEPQNGAFRDSLGWAYFKLANQFPSSSSQSATQHLDKAIIELEKATEFIPDDSEVREHLGEAYLRKGGDFVEKTVLEWEKALEIKPKNASLQHKLGDLRRSLGAKESGESGTGKQEEGETR